MKRVLKFFAWLAGGLLLLGLLLIVLALWLIDPNDHKQRLEDMVRSQVGREATLEGDIKLSVFPWLALDLGRMSLGNAEGFEEARFVSVDNASLRVRLLPLTLGRVEMGTLILDGLDVSLIRRPDGGTNWGDFLEARQREDQAARSRKTHPDHPLAGLNIEGVVLNNAKVVWDDRLNGEYYTLSNLNLKSGMLAPGESLPLEASGKLERRGENGFNADFSLEMALELLPGQQVYRLARGNLQAKVASPRLGEWSPQAFELNLPEPVTLDLANDQFTVITLSLAALDLNLRASLEIQRLTENPTLSGGLNLLGGDLPRLLNRLGVNTSRFPPPLLPTEFKLDSRFSGIWASGQGGPELRLENSALRAGPYQLGLPGLTWNATRGLNLPEATLELAGQLRAKLEMAMTPTTQGASLEGGLTIPEFNLARLLTSLELPVPTLPDPTMLEAVSLETRFSGQPGGEFRLKPFKLNWNGDNSLHLPDLRLDIKAARAEVANLRLEAPEFNLQADAGFFWKQQPELKLILQSNVFNPRRVLEKFNLPPPRNWDQEVLSRASLKTTLAWRPDSLELSELALQVDDSQLTGQAQIKQFSPLDLYFDLSVDRLDLDRYLAAFGMQQQESDGGGQGFSLEWLRELGLHGQLQCGELKIAAMRMRDVALKIEAKDRVVKLAPVSATLYQGDYRGEITLDVRGMFPLLSQQHTLRGVSLAPLLRDIYARDPPMEGRAEISGELSADVGNGERFWKTLNGVVRLTCENCAYKKLNLAQQIKTQHSREYWQTPVSHHQDQSAQTLFSELTATFNVYRSTLHNKDLRLRSGWFQGRGRGTYDLESGELDYVLKLEIADSALVDSDPQLSHLRGSRWPFHLTGSLGNPQLSYHAGGLNNWD